MKIKSSLIGLLSLTLSFTSVSQSNLKNVGTATLNANRVFKNTEVNSGIQPKSLQCVDTLHYPLVKQQQLGPNGNSGFSTFSLWQADAESVSQMFFGYAGMQINGVQILGFRSTSSAATVVVRASIYNVDGTNAPTGSALGNGSVTIINTTQNLYSINFPSPVSVTGNYAVVLDVTNAGGIYTSFFSNAAPSQVIDENLTRYKSNDATLGSNGNWIAMTSITGLGQVVDFEPIVAPIVSYQINTTATVTSSACLGSPVTFTNTTTTPQLGNRMYNYSKYRQHFGFTTNDSTYVWDLDNDANIATTPAADLIWSGNTTHTYANTGTFSPDIISLGGFWQSCLDFQSHSVTINPVDNASFSYASSTVCEGSANLTPTSVTTSGGTFSATAGLIFANASTGEINVGGSTPGTYVITYTTAGTCLNTSTQTLTITTAADPTFTYASTNYCTVGTNPSPAVTGSIGIFSSTPSGLIINPSTGVINLATSSPGIYDVTNTIAASGACAMAVQTVQVTITAAANANFTYPTATYCLSAANPTPNVSGSTGLFSSTLGLSIDANTGEINLASSTPGTYTVTNELPASGACPVISAATQITITANPNATFTYPATSYCSTGSTSPIITGTTGSFTATPSGLSLNASTGVINLANSTPGTYTVTNTIAATATCDEVSNTFVVTVESQPTATVTLSGNTLTAQETGVGYQWINCSGNIAVAGETAQTFTASAGSYAVIITSGTCSATSVCQTVSSAGLEDKSIDVISIYPNPAEHTVTISGLTASNAIISILDVKGRVLISEMTSSATIELPVHNLEKGVYLIHVNSETIRGTKRFIKN